MALISFIAALAVLEYLVIMLMTGRARSRYGVLAPATVGHPIFERWYRVQHNTIEQLVIFLPSLFLFGAYASRGWGVALGLLFIVGRIVYARAYVADPAGRGPGFGLSFGANVILLIGGLVGTLAAM